MRVNKKFLFREVAGEYLLIPSGDLALKISGMVLLSESGKLLYQTLQNECSKDDLVAALRAEYDVSVETAQQDVDEFLDQMRQLEMLLEE